MSQQFKVTPEQVTLCIDSPRRAVDLVRDLLWAEAYRQGVDPSSINFTDRIYSKDGGVDGTSLIDIPEAKGLIEAGKTYYQIKWGKSFQPLNEADMRRELLTKKTKKLKTKLKKLADDDGTYVLIWFGEALKSDENVQVRELIKKIFTEEGYAKIKVKVLDLTPISQHSGQHLVVQSKYFNPQVERFLDLGSWLDRFRPHESKDDAQPDADLGNYFRAYDPIVNDVVAVQKAVSNKPATPVQILCLDQPEAGYSGLSLERARNLVYEALKSDGYGQNTIVIDAEHLEPPISTFLEQTAASLIVVIDNFKQEHERRVLDVIGTRQYRLKLVIISTDAVPIDDARFSLIGRPGLNASSAVKELRSKRPEGAIAHTSNGSSVPVPQKVERPASLTKKYSEISSEYGTAFLNDVKRVLRFLALFSKVGSEINITPEMRFLAQKLGYTEEHEWLKFVEIVHVVRSKGILSGRYYIRIADEDQRLFLIQEWWEVYGIAVNFEKYLREIFIFSEDLAQRLLDSLPYITSTESGQHVAAALLGDNGVFGTGELLKDKFGALLFQKLAEADPTQAVSILKKTIGTWTLEELRKFSTGRREVIWALEKIIVWKELFTDGARILLMLAEAENETWSNNASGVFAGLFSLGYGKVAPTELEPLQRLPMLEDAVQGSIRRQEIVINACNVALDVNYMRLTGSEKHTLRGEPKLWLPATYGDIFDAYKAIWTFLEGAIDTVDPGLKDKATKTLLNHSRELVAIKALSAMVINSLKLLARKDGIDSRIVLTQLEEIIHYDRKRLPAKTVTQLASLRDRLTGTSYTSLMKRYVSLDLLEDGFDEDGNQVDQVLPKIQELAKRSLDNPRLLNKELGWLLTPEAQNGFKFGYELGKIDSELKVFDKLISGLKSISENQSVFLISGYLRAVKENEVEVWEEKMDLLAQDGALQRWIPEISWRSGLTDRAGIRIHSLAEKGVIGPEQFHMFGVGSALDTLSVEVVNQWIEYLLDSSYEGASSIAIDYVHFYFVMKAKAPFPVSLMERVLLDDRLFAKQKTQRNQMDDYYWRETAKAFIKLQPERSEKIAAKMIEYFGEEGTILDGFHSETNSVLDELAKASPEKVWPLIAKKLGPPIDSRAFHLTSWLGGGLGFGGSGSDGALSIFPADLIFGWIDADVDQRARYAASFVPSELFRNEKRVCLARELLVRYGEREDVRNSLRANFSTEGWSGNASSHYTVKRDALLEFRKEESNPNVIQWLDEYVALLDGQIERSKADEERQDF